MGVMQTDKPHWADKPLLRDFFWFLVLPHRFRQWMLSQRHDISTEEER